MSEVFPFLFAGGESSGLIKLAVLKPVANLIDGSINNI
jgi:hypothetical protein